VGLSKVSSRVATTGLAGLVALDVVLVGMALRSNHVSGIDTSPVATASATVSPVRPSPTTPTHSVSPSPTPTLPAASAPLQIVLVALDSQRAWRVSVGSCGAAGAKVTTTKDGGKTWADAKAPLRMIVRVRPTDSQTAFIIGSDSSCAPQLKSTSDGGGTWASDSSVGNAWFRVPKNPRVVQAPGPSTSQPCGQHAVLDLAVLSVGSARVLCEDGLVRSTTDTGTSWTDSGRTAGAVALAVLPANPTQTYVARLEVPGCAGVQVLRLGKSVGTSCIKTALPQNAGQIALSLVDGGGWLAVGKETMRSTDGLATWSLS